jgi:hypothetical protein
MAINMKPPAGIPQVKSVAKYDEHLAKAATEEEALTAKAMAAINLPNEFIQHLKSPSSTGTVKVDHLKTDYGKKTVTPVEETTESMVAPPIPLDKLHNLAVAGKMTINLGNYESAQIMVSLTVPCTKETLEDAYAYASDWVSDKIESAVAKAKKGNS